MLIKSSFLKLSFFIVILLTASLVSAADFDIPHTLNSGEVVSADQLNEILQYIADSQNFKTTADMVGTWSCYGYPSGDYWSTISGYTLEPDGLSYKSPGYALTVTDDGDGTYSYTAEIDEILGQNWDAPIGSSTSGDIQIKANVIGYNTSSGSSTLYSHASVWAGSTQFRIFSSRSYRVWNFTVCNKQNLPPNKATSLSAAVSGSSIMLSWTDNSNDETGFKVMRKSSVTGTWTNIATQSAGATSYVNSSLSAGTYWYRIVATNGNGDSLGSNAVKATVN